MRERGEGGVVARRKRIHASIAWPRRRIGRGESGDNSERRERRERRERGGRQGLPVPVPVPLVQMHPHNQGTQLTVPYTDTGGTPKTHMKL